jgi:lambda family phage portal protein
MTANIVDRVVGYFNPARGVERARARAFLALAGGYEGGRRDKRSMRNWRRRQTSANEDISPDLPDLRTRSRDLIRNVPIATGAVQTVVTNVVGRGLTLSSRVNRKVLKLDDAAAEKWQAAAEQEFTIWGWGTPDFTGRLNWDEIQALAVRSFLESGDVFVARRRRKDITDTYGLKLLFIEADRVSNPNFGVNKVDLVDGIEMDADGKPIAYHISSRHPDDTTSGAQRTWRRFELGGSVTGQPLILHLYRQLRPDQARGVPYLAPVIEAIKQLGNYSEAEAAAAVVAAMFAVFVKRPLPDGTDDRLAIGDTSDAGDPTQETTLKNASVVELYPGTDITVPDLKRPNTGFDAFVTAISRQIGVALGLPYEVLLQSFTASYSASRAALEMAWQTFATMRDWFQWKFCQPVYEWVITEAVASGRLAAPGFFTDPIIREAWLGTEWIGPANISIDPQAEAKADEMDVNNGFKTASQVVAERTGGSWEAKHAQRVKENTARVKDGLIPDPTKPLPAAKPTGAANGA